MKGECPRTQSCPSRGFTLLEIMLVLAIMAVAVALVVPDFFNGRSSSLDDESRRLQVALNLASQESQVRGVPVRWLAMANAYRFVLWDVKGTWDAVKQGPLRPYRLPADIGIAAVKQGQSASLSALMLPAVKDRSQLKASDKSKVIGLVTFWPDGSLTAADVTLVRRTSRMGKPEASRLLRLRPGPGGIRMDGKSNESR